MYSFWFSVLRDSTVKQPLHFMGGSNPGDRLRIFLSTRFLPSDNPPPTPSSSASSSPLPGPMSPFSSLSSVVFGYARRDSFLLTLPVSLSVPTPPPPHRHPTPRLSLDAVALFFFLQACCGNVLVRHVSVCVCVYVFTP